MMGSCEGGGALKRKCCSMKVFTFYLQRRDSYKEAESDDQSVGNPIYMWFYRLFLCDKQRDQAKEVSEGDYHLKDCVTDKDTLHFRHSNIHLVKSFACDLCSYITTEARFLKKHYLVHTKEAPFQCPECARTFRCNSNLRKHFLTGHKNSQMSLYNCGECGFQANLLVQLKQHKCNI